MKGLHFSDYEAKVTGPWRKDPLPEATDPKMNYRYNGKEYNFAGGLGWLDYGARSRRDLAPANSGALARPRIRQWEGGMRWIRQPLNLHIFRAIIMG
jgi:hypothetical protein